MDAKTVTQIQVTMSVAEMMVIGQILRDSENAVGVEFFEVTEKAYATIGDNEAETSEAMAESLRRGKPGMPIQSRR